MRASGVLSLGLVPVILASVALTASAWPVIPPLTYSGSISTTFWTGTQYTSTGNMITGPSDSQGGSAVTSGFASFTSALGFDPMVSASASASSSDVLLVGSGGVAFSLDYFFVPVGPGAVVSINVEGTGTSSGSAAQAGLGIGLVGEPLLLESPFRNWTMNTNIDVVVGQVYDVHLAVQVGAGSAGEGAVAAMASVDPIITIDQSFPDADQFQLLFSDGVGDGTETAIPEPSTGAMLLIAVACLVAWGVRASKQTVDKLPSPFGRGPG